MNDPDMKHWSSQLIIKSGFFTFIRLKKRLVHSLSPSGQHWFFKHKNITQSTVPTMYLGSPISLISSLYLVLVGAASCNALNANCVESEDESRKGMTRKWTEFIQIHLYFQRNWKSCSLLVARSYSLDVILGYIINTGNTWVITHDYSAVTTTT